MPPKCSANNKRNRLTVPKPKPYKLFNADCLDVLAGMDRWSADLTVTSPPYDDLRDYEGNGAEWGEHVWKPVLKRLFRVTKIGGVLVWIVNDATVNGSETGTSFRQVLYAKEIGFTLHDTMVYRKHNFSNPSSARYHQIFDYMFILSKRSPKTFAPIIDRKNVYGGEVGTWGKNTTRQKDSSMVEQTKRVNTDYGQRYNIWKCTTGCEGKVAYQHPAIFPKQLAKDHVISWSNPGDVVLDPFMGSGTTGVACAELGRKFVGIEIVPKYFQISWQRIRRAYTNA